MSLNRAIEILELGIHDHDPDVRNSTGRLVITAANVVMQMAAKVGDQKLQKDQNDALMQLIKNIQEEQKRRTIDAIGTVVAGSGEYAD